MVKIITDSSSLYSKAEGLERNLHITSLKVTINGETYKEYEELNAKEFIDIINQGHLPTSSQPSIGDVLELMEEFKHEDTLVMCMADGLSGTYASAVGARETIEDNDKIKVINTHTLCGPQRYLVDLVSEMNQQNKSIDEMIYEINKRAKTTKSYLLPVDYGYLKRGGRLTPLAATIGGLLKLVPVLTTIDEGRKLDKFAVARTYEIAINKIIDDMKSLGINENHIITISHGFNEIQASIAKEKLSKAFPLNEIRVYELTCSFITQGGPGAIAIQTIER